MKKLILITSAALIGIVSQATAALTVTAVDSSDLANELRGLNKSDWKNAVASGMLLTSKGLFIQNNEIDDGPFMIDKSTPLLVESIYSDAVLRNDFGIIEIKPESFDSVVSNVNGKDSKLITSDSEDKTVLGVAVFGKGSVVPLGMASTSDNDHIWTFVNGKDKLATRYLWMAEDSPETEAWRDFNDYIVLGTLGTISAVPEPSTIISLIAVGFLGLVTWRNRRRAKA